MKKIALLVLVCLLVIVLGLPAVNYWRAESAFKAQKYDEALSLYDSASRFGMFFQSNIEEGKKRTRYAVAEKAVADADYSRAIEMYENLEDQDLLNQTVRTAGDDALSNQRYEEAVKYYTRLGDTGKVDDIRIIQAREAISLHDPQRVEEALEGCGDAQKALAFRAEWAESLANEGDYDNAIAQYRILGETGKEFNVALARADGLVAADKLSEAAESLDGYVGEEVVERILQMAEKATNGFASADAATVAGEFGRHIVDTDSQLRYCEALREKNLDLAAVYPEGVVVNADLSGYQLYKVDDSSGKKPNFERMLVFSRTAPNPPLGPIEVKSASDREKVMQDIEQRMSSTDYPYEVRLRPELMAGQFDAIRAERMEDCTAIVLLDKQLLNDGIITHTTTVTNSRVYALPISTYKTFPHYTAYELIGIYDVKDPTVFISYNGYFNKPLVADAVFGNVYADAGINISREEIARVKAALEDPESEQSKEVLSQYDEKTLKMITENDSGEYFIIPTDDGDPLKGVRCTGQNTSKWNNENYMQGKFEEGWLQGQLDDGAMDMLTLYILMTSLGEQ